jgi:phosphoglycolate phosphatase-like HAD superfamily hydrolase
MRTHGLAIFDIDGTLTATNEVDDECYVAAVAAQLGMRPHEIDWSRAPHVSDTGIARFLWSQHRERLPDDAEIAAVKLRFLGLLEQQLRAHPQRFASVAGASDSVTRLRADGWTIALATGGWGESARMKLRAAGLPVDVPVSCCDALHTREEIVMHARQGAERMAGRSFDRIVSVGDGAWDVRTARALGLPFVGVATGEKAAQLTELGASHVLADLSYGPLREALAAAGIPA